MLLAAGCWNGPHAPGFPGGDETVVLWPPDTVARLVPDIADELEAAPPHPAGI